MRLFFILRVIGREVYPERSATESKGVQSPLLRKASQKCEAFLLWVGYNISIFFLPSLIRYDLVSNTDIMYFSALF